MYRTFEDYVSSNTFGSRADTRFHVGLLPIPYVVDLSTASIIILMLNPGLATGDYFFEQYRPEWRTVMVNNLRQEGLDEKYPFMFLNPRFSWHTAFRYWNKKFRPLAAALEEQRKIFYKEALSVLSRQVAGLELVPDHSRSYRERVAYRELASRKLAKEFVDKYLVKRAKNNKLIVVVTRAAKVWGLKNECGIVIYKNHEARSASLGIKSSGGQKIAEALGVVQKKPAALCRAHVTARRSEGA